MMSCLICDKHKGISNQPAGGYFYDDDHWKVCHYLLEDSACGQVVVESKRHFLDFSEMTHEEAESYGILLKKLYSAMKQVVDAERVYTVIFVDGVPHFHAHLIPRYKDSEYKGMRLLNQNSSCSEEEAMNVVNKLRQALV